MLSVVGVLAALWHAKRTGEGQELWTSLLDGGTVVTSDVLLADGRGIDRPRLDKAQTGFDPAYSLYETQDGWVQVAALKAEQWDALCTTRIAVYVEQIS